MDSFEAATVLARWGELAGAVCGGGMGRRDHRGLAGFSPLMQAREALLVWRRATLL